MALSNHGCLALAALTVVAPTTPAVHHGDSLSSDVQQVGLTYQQVMETAHLPESGVFRRKAWPVGVYLAESGGEILQVNVTGIISYRPALDDVSATDWYYERANA